MLSGFLMLLIRFLLLSLFIAPAVVSADATPNVEKIDAKKPYVHSEEKCIRCHTDKTELQNVLTSSLAKCKTCHESNQPTSAPKKHQKKKHALQRNKLKRAVVPNRKPTYGMQYSLYTKGSRLGGAPNKMVKIPAGEFLMGTDDRLSDEGPAHTVNLPDYFIDIFEVTNLQYKKFNDATRGRSPRHWRNRTFPPGKADHPVVYVTWENASAYCDWAGKRLPSDKEWEKAARGTDGRIFPWGDEFDTAKANTPVRWQEIGQFGDTTPVGAFTAGKSPHGVYDMSGNVWEWTDSWYKPYPGNHAASESYGERYKTLKGGSWFNCSFYKCGISAPVFNRSFFAKKVKNDSFGFRCAKTAE